MLQPEETSSGAELVCPLPGVLYDMLLQNQEGRLFEVLPDTNEPL